MQTNMSQEEIEFMNKVKEYHRQWWAGRNEQLKKESKREEKGFWYLALSVVSIMGGASGIIYGLLGRDWVQKPYIIMGAVLILFGLSVVIGGFGKVKGQD